MSFENKSVVVTGASSGLGAVLAESFAARGASLTLFARRQPDLEAVAERCRAAGGKAIVFAGSVSELDDCRKLAGAAEAEYGGIDVLVANAGVSMWARFDETEDTQLFRDLIDVNYMGAVNCVHACLPAIKARKGVITAVGSIQGKIPVPLHTGYVASKHALQGFLDTLRGELDGTGVDVVTALPHWLRGTRLRSNAFAKDGERVGEGRRGHNKESVSLEACSEAILRAIERRDREVVIPWKLRLLPWLKLIAPRMLDRIVSGEMKRQG